MDMIISNRVYEDFDPPYDLVREQRCDTILVNLPGFKKDQLRVQLTTSRMLKVSGERPLGGNKWRRFYKEFSVPDFFDTRKITSKFENGILYIRQPKFIPAEGNVDQFPMPLPPQSQPLIPQAPPFPTPSDLLKEIEDAQKRREKEKQPPRKVAEKKDKCESSTAERLKQGADGSGLFKELKKPENLKRLVVSVLMVLIVGFYISHIFKSFTRKEQQILLKCDQEL